MEKLNLIIAVLFVMVMNSCNNDHSSKDLNNNSSKTPRVSHHDIVQRTLKNREGEILELIFDNTAMNVLIKYQGKQIVLTEQQTGSGIRYTNDQYELRGKGEDLHLSKNGEVIFVSFPSND